MADFHALRTEFDFTLPCGYVDGEGHLHREGVMRLATARDELASLQDPRVQANTAYLSIVLLSRVVTRIGALSPVSPEDVEGLFSADFVHLQDLFVQVNDVGAHLVQTQCPTCSTRFVLDLVPAGDS
jgi:hypothetical protein